MLLALLIVLAAVGPFIATAIGGARHGRPWPVLAQLAMPLVGVIAFLLIGFDGFCDENCDSSGGAHTMVPGVLVALVWLFGVVWLGHRAWRRPGPEERAVEAPATQRES